MRMEKKKQAKQRCKVYVVCYRSSSAQFGKGCVAAKASQGGFQWSINKKKSRIRKIRKA